MIFYLFASIVVVTGITIHLRTIIGLQSLFDKMLFLFLLTILIHTSLTAFLRFIFAANTPISATFSLLYGPLLYFCFKSLKSDNIQRSSLLIHALPFILSFPLYGFVTISKDIDFNHTLYLSLPLYIALFLSWTCYPLWTLLKKPGQRASLERSSLLLFIAYTLITQSIYLMLLLLLGSVVHESLINSSSVIYFFVCILCIVLFIYGFTVNELKGRKNQTAKKSIVAEENKASQEEALLAYRKSKIENTTLQKCKKDLEAYMQTRPYLKPNLSLEEVANELKIYKHHCSQLFNGEYGMSFSQYINSKRLEYACHLLKKEELPLNIEELSEKCGFNSKASFYRNFTNTMGCTPTEYRARSLKKNSLNSLA